MRVKAPGDGASPIREVDRAEAPEPTRAAEAVDGAASLDSVAPVASVGAVEGAAAVGASGDSEALADIARRLKAGDLSAADAIELIIDDVVGRSAGTLQGDRRLADELKELLRRQADTDPYLASRVRRLGKPQ